MAESVVIALISGGFTIVVALIHKLIKDNAADHGIVHTSLDRIEKKIDRHITDHDK